MDLKLMKQLITKLIVLLQTGYCHGINKCLFTHRLNYRLVIFNFCQHPHAAFYGFYPHENPVSKQTVVFQTVARSQVIEKIVPSLDMGRQGADTYPGLGIHDHHEIRPLK